MEHEEALQHLVVAREPVDAALYENQPELSVLVLPVELQVLPHGHRLLDEVVQVLWNLGCQAEALHDAQDLGPCDGAHLHNARTLSVHAQLMASWAQSSVTMLLICP